MPVFHFDPNGKCIAVLACLSDGQAMNLDVALDTGATLCTIPAQLARRLSLGPRQGVASESFVTPTGEVTFSILELPRLGALGHVAADVEVIPLDMRPAAGVKAVLGLNFLRNFKLFINFPKGKLVLLRKRPGLIGRLRDFVDLLRVYW